MDKLELFMAAVDGGDGESSVYLFEDKNAAEIMNYAQSEKSGLSEIVIETLTISFNGEAKIDTEIHTAEDLIKEYLDADDEDDVEFVQSLGLKFPGL